MPKTAIKQRADYTHKYNRNIGRHGWLRLTPAYSVKVVDEIFRDWDSTARVLDPFAGTATTALCAAYAGHPVSTVEINPFLVWFGEAKTAFYHPTALTATKEQSENILKAISKNSVQACSPPPIHKIKRWWNPNLLEFLCTLKAGIDKLSPDTPASKTLMLIAFCRLMIRLSNASFNHQSMSFKQVDQKELFLCPHMHEYDNLYHEELDFVLYSAYENPVSNTQIIHGDAKKVDGFFDDKFDLVITSPPYPNRMSYIRELRPYMYWLGYLKEAREAGELDWKCVGGTWGIATSRLSDWERHKDSFYPDYLNKILSDIATDDNKNGVLLSNYIAKYFEDMW